MFRWARLGAGGVIADEGRGSVALVEAVPVAGESVGAREAAWDWELEVPGGVLRGRGMLGDETIRALMSGSRSRGAAR